MRLRSEPCRGSPCRSHPADALVPRQRLSLASRPFVLFQRCSARLSFSAKEQLTRNRASLPLRIRTLFHYLQGAALPSNRGNAGSSSSRSRKKHRSRSFRARPESRSAARSAALARARKEVLSFPEDRK